jgi:outer membrane biosynthesis protein TonB
MGPLTSRPVSEAITTTPTTKTTKTTPTTTKVDQPTHLETKVKKVNTPNQVNMEPLRVKDSVVVSQKDVMDNNSKAKRVSKVNMEQSQVKGLVVVSPRVPMDNNSRDKDRDRPTTLVFQDNMVPRDNGVLHRETKVVESTLLNVVITKDGLRTIVRL